MSGLIEQLRRFFERGEPEALEELGGIQGLAREFNTDLQAGISGDEVPSGYADRKLKWGENILPDPPAKSWCRLFLDTFKDVMLKMLVILSILSLVLTVAIERSSDWVTYIDPIAILIAVLIVSSTTAQTNYSQQKSFREISKMKNEFPANVIRHGEEMQIPSTQLLVGDILSLKNGDGIPVDCLYISGHSLKIDLSQSTGESVPVSIDERHPVIQSGAAVDSGEANALVCAVGFNSQYGIILKKLQDMNAEEKPTPLQAKLNDIASFVTKLGAIGAGLVLVVLLIIWIVDVTKNKWSSTYLSTLMDDLMIAVTLFVGAVPEGLPLAVVISLGFSMKRMMKDNNFVRNLSACETMGGATTICSDKTGTLTQNMMTVVTYYMDGKDFSSQPDVSENVKELIRKSVAVNTNAYLTIKDGVQEYVGKSTECALLKMIAELGADYSTIRKKYEAIIVHDFNSTRKRMSTIVREESGFKIYIKGAPEIVIKKCTHFLRSTGERETLTDEIKDSAVQRINELADDQLRTILLAYSDLPGESSSPEWEDPSNVEKDLTLIGVCGIRDPLRPEVAGAIQACKRAGVVVRMVTGDNINTAISIARQCGILSEDGHAMLGKEFSAMSKVQLIDRLPKLQVLARSSPLDKYRLVGLLMECGEVVAVTGDGSNDSTALKRANVGLAMGSGTELAKMASDIVILDDNFNSIVSALKWGRCIYDNVRGFIQFQLTVNVSSMILSFAGSLVLKKSPLRAIELLWISLIMDSLGALALATKGPFESLLDRPPYGESGSIISRLLYRNIIVHAIFQTIILMLILFGSEVFFKISSTDVADTFLFNVFVFMQVFNLLNARVADESTGFFEGLFNNWVFWALILGISAVQAVIVEFGGDVFGTVGLNWAQWLESLGLGMTELIIGAITRLFHIRDDTRDKLVVHREEKRLIMRRKYTQMTPSMMWRESQIIPEKHRPSLKEAVQEAEHEIAMKP